MKPSGIPLRGLSFVFLSFPLLEYSFNVLYKNTSGKPSFADQAVENITFFSMEMYLFTYTFSDRFKDLISNTIAEFA
jgi:hypothetical protein